MFRSWNYNQASLHPVFGQERSGEGPAGQEAQSRPAGSRHPVPTHISGPECGPREPFLPGAVRDGSACSFTQSVGHTGARDTTAGRAIILQLCPVSYLWRRSRQLTGDNQVIMSAVRTKEGGFTLRSGGPGACNRVRRT